MGGMTESSFGVTGYTLLIAYMAFMVACGAYFARRQRVLSDFFLGGRSIPAWAVLLAIVATETSSVTFVGTPAMSFWGDCSFLQLVFGYCIARVILAIFFVPAFRGGELFTIYQHLGHTYGPGVQRLAGVFFFVTKVLAAGVRHYCAALVLQVVTGWDPLTSVVVMGVISLAYCVMGGLSAVIWTEVVQMLIMLTGAIIALVVMIQSVPSLPDAWNLAVETGRMDVFNFDHPFSTTGYNFWNGLIGGTFLSLASHGADQDLVQRLLACKSLRGAKGAMVGSGLLVLVQFGLFLVIGVLLFGFYASQVDRVIVQPEGAESPTAEITYETSTPRPAGVGERVLVLDKRDDIFPRFILQQLSPLVAALVIAAIFAAAMSSTASALNSLASTTMTDFIRPLRKKASTEAADLKLSRMLTVGWCAVLMLVAYLSKESDSILQTALAVASFTFGSLLGAFLLSIFTHCRNAAGTAVGMLLGLLAALVLAFVLQDAVHWTWRIPVASAITMASGLIGSWVAPGKPAEIES